MEHQAYDTSLGQLGKEVADWLAAYTVPHNPTAAAAVTKMVSLVGLVLVFVLQVDIFT